MPTVLPFVRGDASNKAKGAAGAAAKSKSSGGSGGGMKAFQQKLGGGGSSKPGPSEMMGELAGKRLIPGHNLPHVTLHTVQVGRCSAFVCCPWDA